jgi:hypothetical protein
MAQAFKSEFVAYAGIEELGHRMAARVCAEVGRSNRGMPAARRHRPHMGWYLLAAALILVSVAAVAATRSTLKISWRSSQLTLPDPSAPEASPRGHPRPGVAPREQPIAERADEAVADPVVSTAPDGPSGEPSPADPARADPRVPPARTAGSAATGERVPTARDLFASATAARHEDNGSRASALYRELQGRYPTSAEALVSRVSFGRVLLDRLDDPAGALAQFDGYLAQTAHTSLAEEALSGRASALSRLGRPEAERETWRTLLARYPLSVYADRARVRIGSIR